MKKFNYFLAHFNDINFLLFFFLMLSYHKILLKSTPIVDKTRDFFNYFLNSKKISTDDDLNKSFEFLIRVIMCQLIHF